MSLEIKVNPEAVNSLVERAREVPNERIERAIKKLNDLENALSSWEGNGKSSHDAACANLKSSLTETRNLMNGILATLDNAVDEFTEMDEEISMKFESTVDNYTSN